MKNLDCAAKRQRDEVRAKKIANSPIHHQNIEGVLVPTLLVGQAFALQEANKYPNYEKAQILQKSDLSVPCSNFDWGQVAQQSVGVCTPKTCTEKNPGFSTARDPYSQITTPGAFGPIGSIEKASTLGATGAFSAVGATGAVGTADISTHTMSQSTSPKLKISQSGILYTLHMIRDPVVDYQESRGVSRNEEITFLTLVTSLCTQAYTAAITILVMLWNLMPLVDGLVYFVRFCLDKLIDIAQTEDNKDRAIKGVIFFGELTIITFIIFFIIGLIFMPVYVLMARLFAKVFSIIAW